MKQQWKAGDSIECDLSFAAMTISDAPDGFIAGIASTPSTDLYGHKVLAGAFDESIKTKGLTGPRGVKLLMGHDWNRPGGVIKRLETKGDKLEIEAQLNLNVSYVRDVYEVTKQNGGLNYSVGFRLKEFEFVDEEQMKSADDAWLIVKQGDLMEVSVVVFPAQLEAEMTFVKQHESMSELEKALAAQGFCHSRNEAHRLIKYIKANEQLFLGQQPPSAGLTALENRPVLDVHQLKAATDLVARAKAILSPR
jgi:HK97 family phage prohead protease